MLFLTPAPAFATRTALKSALGLRSSDRTPTTKLVARYLATCTIVAPEPLATTEVDDGYVDDADVWATVDYQELLDSKAATVEPPTISEVQPTLGAATVGVWFCLALLCTFEVLRDLFVAYCLPHIVTAVANTLDNGVRFLCHHGIADYRLANRFGVSLH